MWSSECKPVVDPHLIAVDGSESCRYALTLEAMKSDENFLWMQLSKCRITDKRTRKVSATMFTFHEWSSVVDLSCMASLYSLNLAYKWLQGTLLDSCSSLQL